MIILHEANNIQLFLPSSSILYLGREYMIRLIAHYLKNSKFSNLLAPNSRGSFLNCILCQEISMLLSPHYLTSARKKALGLSQIPLVFSLGRDSS